MSTPPPNVPRGTLREMLDALSLEALMLRLGMGEEIAIPVVNTTKPKQIEPSSENNQ